jgi:pyridoxal phosphate enzyme (YggS family)
VETAVAGRAADVASRLADVKEQIARAARRAGRDPAAVTLVAVSKTVPPERIREALDAGVTDLGENRVQEAEGKVSLLPPGLRWHLVGQLQRNKINKALDLFSLIHSVESVAQGQAISERAARRGLRARVLLQVNVAEAGAQGGFPVSEVGAGALALAGAPGLALDGLMCIAPHVEQIEATRPAFRTLAALFGELRDSLRQAGHPWSHLSMGMTDDYPVAVEEGATLVRVGRAIFGERPALPASGAPAVSPQGYLAEQGPGEDVPRKVIPPSGGTG